MQQQQKIEKYIFSTKNVKNASYRLGVKTKKFCNDKY